MITTKDILISKGILEEEADIKAVEIDEVVRKSYYIHYIGFANFRNIVIKAMFG